MVEHNSGLNAGDAAGRIDFENPRHVLGKIEDDRDVAALPGKRCAAAAAEQRRPELTAQRDSGKNIVVIARQHDADRNLPVVGAVGRVERAAALIEADFAADPFSPEPSPDLTASTFADFDLAACASSTNLSAITGLSSIR
jgi:hypothetical protein